MPRFDKPCLTRPGQDVCSEVGFEIGGQRPLPHFGEPAAPPVLRPVDEPLVAVNHPRISNLGNYLRAGWAAARPGTWLRHSAFDRLCGVAESLPERLGLCVFDAWRPLDLQAELYEVAYRDPALPAGFVSPPIADPTMPPPHLTGGTVDLSLTLDGVPLGLGAGFDDFTPLARADALEPTAGIDRELRRLLFWSMHDAGFVVLDCEWWHYEFGTRRWGAITGAEPRFGPAAPPS